MTCVCHQACFLRRAACCAHARAGCRSPAALEQREGGWRGARVLRGAHIVRHLRVVAEEVDGALRGARHAHHTAAPRMRTRARAPACRPRPRPLLPPETPACRPRPRPPFLRCRHCIASVKARLPRQPARKRRGGGAVREAGRTGGGGSARSCTSTRSRRCWRPPRSRSARAWCPASGSASGKRRLRAPGRRVRAAGGRASLAHPQNLLGLRVMVG